MSKYSHFVSMAILAAGGVNADIITDFVSTGAGLGAGATDGNYRLTAQPGPAAYGPAMVVTPDSGFPFPYWIDNDANSKWIVPSGASLLDMDDSLSLSDKPVGDYTVHTEFTIPTPAVGYQLNGVLLRFKVAADNAITDILVNGHSLNFGYPAFPAAPEYGYKAFSGGIDLSTDEGYSYTPGQTVTLDFDIWNKPQDSGNPMGFRLEVLAAETGVSPVPEPSAYALCAGFGLIGFAGYRRLKQ